MGEHREYANMYHVWENLAGHFDSSSVAVFGEDIGEG